MYNDLFSFKQLLLNSSTYSHASKKYAVFLPEGISIYCFKSGILKKEVVRISVKDYNKKDYKIGEPEAPVFPLLRNSQLPKEDVEFKFGSFSDIYLPSLGGGFQLLVLTTSNSNVLILRSPDISSTSLSYTWEYVSNISDILHLALHDTEFNKPIKENKTEYTDRNFNSRPYIHENEIISNLEFKKRAEWLSPISFAWSNIMKCFWFEDENESENSGVEENKRMVLLSVGTKRGLVLYRCVLPSLNSHFSGNNFSIFKLVETNDWILASSWKPIIQDDDSLADSGIIAIALGNGSVLLQTIYRDGEIELLDTIVQEDFTPVSFLEWGPVNENGQSYLIICKGLGFYIYNFEKKKLSGFVLAHRDKISSISFSDYSHFSTASNDCNIIDYNIDSEIWDSQELPKITPSSINLISNKENQTLGIYSILSSPNRLITLYIEELPKIKTMFQKSFTSRFALSYKVPTYSFQSFKTSFYQKFKAEGSGNIWDYFFYINIYSNEEILQFIDELVQSQPDNIVIHYKFIIKLYYLLKKKSKEFKNEELNEKIEKFKLFIKENYVINFLKSFLAFISEDKEYRLLDYQKTSVTLMVHYLRSTSNDHAQLCKDVMKIMGKSIPFEVCVYCSKEIPIGEDVKSIIECQECCSDIERCSRTFLLISTPKTLNCDYCYSRSLVFADEDLVENPIQVLDQAIFEKSSIRYQFPWVKAAASCVFCRTPLNGLSSDDRCVFP